MGNSPSRDPLEPIGKYPPAPWANQALGAKKYDGRAEWWGEPDYQEHPQRAKRWRLAYYPHKEIDPIWYDAPVPDGTSLLGPGGLDSTYSKDLSKKFDQPGNFYEFQKSVMKNSEQYKQIAEKCDLSEEHPGIKVNPTMVSSNHMHYHQMGKDLFLSNSWSHLGPRFWDHPINEGCLTKGLCLAKYAAFFTIPYTLLDIQSSPPAFYNRTGYFKAKDIGLRYVSSLPLPCALSFTYGASLCATANIRDIDDYLNFWAASGLTGLTLSTLKDNVSAGVLFFLVTGIFGTLFQAARTEIRGLQGKVQIQNLEGNLMNSPLTWKFFKGRDRDIPNEKY